MLLSKSDNGWELRTIARGSLSCENYKYNSEEIDRIEQMLKSRFDNQMKEEHIMVSYDNWSGVFIMQIPGFQSDSSDDIMKLIFAFLSEEDN
ncbi:MAG: hypothetical protein IJ079_03700 [Lachnospiraceae bacterium]|nr:hypothetical protein [Lachnospiraceae bacterium]